VGCGSPCEKDNICNFIELRWSDKVCLSSHICNENFDEDCILNRLEAEASDDAVNDACDCGKCFGALAMLLESIDHEVSAALYSMQRETIARAEDAPYTPATPSLGADDV
jgi:hypothetical protein